MVALAIVFLVVPLIAADFGYRGAANKSWKGAKLFFVIFLVLAVIAFFTQMH